MDFMYQQIIAGKQKAIVAYVVTALIQYLSDNGVKLPDTTGEVVTALLVGLIGYVAVYLKRNKA